MRYTKKQKEIIAYSLSLLVDECEVKETKENMISIIQDLQSQKVFGYVDFYKSDLEY